MGKEGSKLVAVTGADLSWRRPLRPDGQEKGLQFSVVMEKIAGAPVVQLSHYDPHWTEPRHRHLEDEVLLLFDGELTVDGELFTAPTVVYVPRGVLYGPLTAGSEGAKFFRLPFDPGTFPSGREYVGA